MSKTRKKFLVALAVCGAATLFQTGSGCAQYYLNMGLTSFDFCSVFNCTSGSYFNLCEPVPLLIDCPNVDTTTP